MDGRTSLRACCLCRVLSAVSRPKGGHQDVEFVAALCTNSSCLRAAGIFGCHLGVIRVQVQPVRKRNCCCLISSRRPSGLAARPPASHCHWGLAIGARARRAARCRVRWRFAGGGRVRPHGAAVCRPAGVAWAMGWPARLLVACMPLAILSRQGARAVGHVWPARRDRNGGARGVPR